MVLVKKAITDRRGGITLEAAIIFPTIMLMLFSLVFFSMYVYEKLVVLDTATYTSAQRAATWDNSYKDLETGSLDAKAQSDGLYWRLFNDSDHATLALEKILEAYGMAGNNLEAGLFHGDREIDICYDNQLIQRLVSVSVEENITLPAFVGSSFGSEVSARAVAGVAEPVEYIRNLDALRYYWNTIGSYMDGFRNRQNHASKVYITKNEYEEKVFHTDPGCRYVKRISQHGNLKILKSETVAKDLGYRICKVCAGNSGR